MNLTGVGGLFTLISLLYVYNAYQLLRSVYQNWADFTSEPLTLYKKGLVERGAFLIAVPPSVVLHELFHAVAVWLLGGRVVGAGFFFFWGYVSHSGAYTPFEQWLISFSGTIGSLLFGVLLWLALRGNRSSALRYFGLRSLRMQIILSLIYYPLFTVIFPAGDWRTIYDFGATPLWSGLTLLLHGTTLLGYWFAERRGLFERPAFRSVAGEQEYRQLRQQETAAVDRDDQFRQIQYLRYGGATNRAKQQLQKFLDQYPDDAEAHFELGLLRLGQGDKIARAAVLTLKEALELGLADWRKKMLANQIIGQYHQRGNELEEAIGYYSSALEAAAEHSNSNQPQNGLAMLFHLRGQTFRQMQQYEKARQDIRQAIEIAKLSNDQPAVQQYQNELTIIEDSMGRSFLA